MREKGAVRPGRWIALSDPMRGRSFQRRVSVGGPLSSFGGFLRGLGGPLRPWALSSAAGRRARELLARRQVLTSYNNALLADHTLHSCVGAVLAWQGLLASSVLPLGLKE